MPGTTSQCAPTHPGSTLVPWVRAKKHPQASWSFYRSPQCIYLSLSLSLWHLSVLQINPTQRVSCNTLYTPTRIIQKKKWFLLRTPKWLSQKKKHFKPSRFTDFAAAVLVDDMLRSWGISGWKMREGFLKKAAAKTMSRCLKKRLAP